MVKSPGKCSDTSGLNMVYGESNEKMVKKIVLSFTLRKKLFAFDKV